MAVIRSIINFIWYGTATLALVVMFIVGVSIFSHKANIFTFTVLSGSMEPAIKTGSFIVTRPMQEYWVGDVVTRRVGDESVTVTHRIIGKFQQDDAIIYHTKGDANELMDEDDVKQSDIVGKVAYILPYAGYPVHFSKSKPGFILLIIIPMMFIICDESINIYKILKKRKIVRQNGPVSGVRPAHDFPPQKKWEHPPIGRIMMSDAMSMPRYVPMAKASVPPQPKTRQPMPPPAPRRKVV
ncbi:MAG: signal peptidase I [Candidatus Moranbacteria bacterium]|nr:signal peptidase I [Candidatus Moranbacteria bacterium]